MKKIIAHTVEEYIAKSVEMSRGIQKKLRSIILATVPGVTESINWGVPFYKLNKPVCGFAVYKNHVSFGVTLTISKQDHELLKKEGYKTGIKTIQIQFDKKVPKEQIISILKQNV
jgi:uncharacterized protein